MRRKRAISSSELKRKHSSWMKNLVYGIQELVNEDPTTQHYLFFILLQDTLYNGTTSPFFAQMYNRDEDFYKVDTDGGLEDYQLAPLHRKKLLGAFEDVITGGGRRKFTNILSELKQSFEKGEY
tara:strand:- start:838 stop:1209 length:372 start_codon:yes stop_codon:yes gene_type:complete